MKKFLIFPLLFSLLFTLSSCAGELDHTGEANPPATSENLKGKMYGEVEKAFKEQGFTNIQLSKIEDLTDDDTARDGEVENVLIGGATNYETSTWIPVDTKVLIRYHTLPSKKTSTPAPTSNSNKTTPAPQFLTVENCEELAAILSNKAEFDDSYIDFSKKYKGKAIRFDGNIASMAPHGDYKTRYDILVTAGDYDLNSVVGPSFRFTDVSTHDLGLDTMYIEEELHTGDSIEITATVGEFDTNNGLFYLDPIKVTKR